MISLIDFWEELIDFFHVQRTNYHSVYAMKMLQSRMVGEAEKNCLTSDSAVMGFGGRNLYHFFAVKNVITPQKFVVFFVII